jgi:Zn finger protein HypA/HybF involved in hydrogenase expression
VTVEPLNRTLEQELNALLRGASLECLACGEFVMHLAQGGIFCPECGSGLDVAQADSGGTRLQFPMQAG